METTRILVRDKDDLLAIIECNIEVFKDQLTKYKDLQELYWEAQDKEDEVSAENYCDQMEKLEIEMDKYVEVGTVYNYFDITHFNIITESVDV